MSFDWPNLTLITDQLLVLSSSHDLSQEKHSDYKEASLANEADCCDRSHRAALSTVGERRRIHVLHVPNLCCLH